MSSEETEGTGDFFIDSAIVTGFLWLVPNVFIAISHYRITLAQSTSLYWKDERLAQGLKAVTKHSRIAIAVSLLTITATAIAVSLTTRNLDSRMISVLAGLSRLVACVILFFLSYKIPKWLGVYHSVSYEYGKAVGESIQVLSFNVRWAIYGQFFMMYFYMLPFYCGVHAATIPVSALIGIVAGFLIVLGVYAGRTRFKAHKSRCAYALAIVLNLLSSIALAYGCYFIQTVWGNVEENDILLACVTFFSWLFIQLVCHYCLWKVSKRGFAAMKRRSLRSQGVPKYHTQLFDPKTFLDTADDNVDMRNDVDVMSPIAEVVEGKSADEKNDAEEADSVVKQEDVDMAENEERGKVQVSHGDNEEIVNMEAIQRISFIDAGQDDPQEGRPEEEAKGDKKEGLEAPFSTLLKAKLFGWCCCCKDKCYRYDSAEPREKSRLEKSLRALQLIFNICLSLFFLYITITNIGASVQMEAVNTQLNQTFELLYPPSYNTGPICAFDNRGPDSNITTFGSPEAANASGFVPLHCGVCGACSSWQNLQANWLTRTNLASLSQKCAKKLLFGGYGAALDCHSDTIGFDEACSACWVEDEICARDHCVFIYLQANLINKVGNFSVGHNTITSATCDEAICGPKFVPCSGATRRRMNIVSDIARPVSQQCRIVQINWTELFG